MLKLFKTRLIIARVALSFLVNFKDYLRNYIVILPQTN